MRKIGKTLGLLFLIIFIGSILGGLVGEIIGIVIPNGKLHQIFTQGPNLALAPSTWDFIILSLTFGFSFKINLCSLIGILAAVFLFRRL